MMHQLQFIKFYLLCGCIWLASVCQQATAQQDSTSLSVHQFFVDDAQHIIDRLDLRQDHKIQLAETPEINKLLESIYFDRIDSLQKFIDKYPATPAAKITMLQRVYYLLREVNLLNYTATEKYESLFRLMTTLLTENNPDICIQHLLSNMAYSFMVFDFFATQPYSEDFLKKAAQSNPDIVLSHFYRFQNNTYSERVIISTACEAPGTIKKYLLPGNPIFKILQESENPCVKKVIDIHNLYGKTTAAYSLLDPIVKGKMSIQKADSISKKQNTLLIKLIDARAEKNPLGRHTLERELENISLKIIRKINDAHNESDAVRFADINQLSREEIYTIIVYGQEEIFTSSFNGCLKRFLEKLGDYNGRSFLEMMGDNRFRTFIKMCASFGKLPDFFSTMTRQEQKEIIEKIGSNLESETTGLANAIEVADLFNSLKDTVSLEILENKVVNEYLRVKKENNIRGKLIYGLLLQFLKMPKHLRNGEIIAEQKKYPMTGIERINSNDLFNTEDESNWMILFYDDEDGANSFRSFMSTFNESKWIISDSGDFIIIQSAEGRAVNLFANKPQKEYEGQAQIEKWFSDHNIEPNVIAHRGHSYYALKTIERLGFQSRLFVLGSCGGYNSISSIIERSPEIAIISSKQIGTMFVNNPLLQLMADHTRLGKDLNWPIIWELLQKKVISKKEVYSRFLDYLPPHKNQAALFIRAYNHLIGMNTGKTIDK
jgi:hypothetical protein